MQRGSPVIRRIPAVFKGHRAKVYVLRIEHTLSHHTALAVTHIPGGPVRPQGQGTDAARGPARPRGAKTYAMLLGCSPADEAEMADRLRLQSRTIVSPFTIIKLFLELERDRRFDIVDRKIRSFETIIENYGREQQQQQQRCDVWALRSTGDLEDLRRMIGLYLEVCHLKNGLAAWRAQLDAFVKFAGDFGTRPHAPEEDEGNGDVDPAEYLHALVEEYDIKFNKCDMVLQGATLMFQLETAHISRLDAKLARLDTKIALRDGKHMKAIALLTMFFLPGTFVAVCLYSSPLVSSTAHLPAGWLESLLTTSSRPFSQYPSPTT